MFDDALARIDTLFGPVLNTKLWLPTVKVVDLYPKNGIFKVTFCIWLLYCTVPV